MAPSFYKILLDPSSPHLRLPTQYGLDHLENRIPDGPIIISVSGGYSWTLKINKIGDCYYFTDGWKNVVEDIPLGVADFLMFQTVDQSKFKMLIHNPNGCQKLLPPKADYAGSSDDDDDDDDDDDIEESKDDDPMFTSVITTVHNKILRFTSKFAEVAGINANGSLTVKNLEGREWVMRLRAEKSTVAQRYYLSTGWIDFRRENHLSKGDECVFKFIRSERKLVLAKITKKPPSGEVSGDGGEVGVGTAKVVKRPRGRPRKQ